MAKEGIIENAKREFISLVGGEDEAKPLLSDFQDGLFRALTFSPITRAPYLRNYVKATTHLPLPTNKQISNFSRNLAGPSANWYKFSGFMEFLVFMEAFPQHIMGDGGLVEITDELLSQHDCWRLVSTKQVIDECGYLAAIPIVYQYRDDYGRMSGPGPHYYSQYLLEDAPNSKLEMITDKNDITKKVYIPREFMALNQRMKCGYVNPLSIIGQLVSMREIVKEARDLLAKNIC